MLAFLADRGGREREREREGYTRTALLTRPCIAAARAAETTFLACLKVTTLFVFGFFDMIMTPAYLQAGEPLLKTAGGTWTPSHIPFPEQLSLSPPLPPTILSVTSN